MQTQDAVEGLHNFVGFSQLSLVFRWKYKYVNTEKLCLECSNRFPSALWQNRAHSRLLYFLINWTFEAHIAGLGFLYESLVKNRCWIYF